MSPRFVLVMLLICSIYGCKTRSRVPEKQEAEKPSETTKAEQKAEIQASRKVLNRIRLKASKLSQTEEAELLRMIKSAESSLSKLEDEFTKEKVHSLCRILESIGLKKPILFKSEIVDLSKEGRLCHGLFNRMPGNSPSSGGG